MQKQMKITFKDGRPPVTVPYSPQNQNQYSKILGTAIQDIEIVEDGTKVPVILPPRPGIDFDPITGEKKTMSSTEMQAEINRRVQEAIADLTKRFPIQHKLPSEQKEVAAIRQENFDVVSDWKTSGLSKNAYCKKTGFDYQKLLKLTKNLQK